MHKPLPALLFFFCLTLPSVAPAREKSVRFVQVYAHRGARSFVPENTLAGTKASLRIGTDWVDVDIVLTGDGEVLVSHDPVLNPDIVRGPDGKFLAASKEALGKMSKEEKAAYIHSYSAKNLTLRELRKFDVGRINSSSAYARFFPDQIALDGTRMPTLREVIQLVKRAAGAKVGFQIEMKTDPGHPEYSADPSAFAKALYRILRDEKILDRAEIQAFDFRCLVELRKLDQRVKTAFLTSRENEKGGADSFFSDDPAQAGLWTGGKLGKDFGSIPRLVKAMGGYAWEPEDAELTKEALDEAHRLGLKVVVWSWPEQLGTAFDSRLTEKMIEWGVDGIITDDPARLISLLAARGRHVPARYSVE